MAPTQQDRGGKALRRLVRGVLRLELPLFALWIGLAVGLSAITGRVVDWFVMTDELLYERLAISVSRLHSLLPHVHGDLIPNAGQLYPLLIAPAFSHGYVPGSLHSAHVLNAFVMTSAAVPAFLLARSVTRRRPAAYFVALLSVCVPWMVFSSFLLTEVAAYPAFLWCVLALHRATVTPRLANDVLAIAGIALATLARTQFFVLVVVLGPAILYQEIASTDGATWGTRLRSGVRAAVSGHRLLAGFYAVLGVVVGVLSAAGQLSAAVGTYAQAVEGNPFPAHFIPSLAEHLSTIALAIAVLPFVIGVAWLVSGLAGECSRERRSFAAVGALTLAVLTVEVTSFDLRFGGGVVRERYLFYVVPVLLVAFAGALSDRRWPRWSLVVPLPFVLYGFWHSGLPQYPKLNIDTPVSILYDELFKLVHTHRAGHVTLVAGTLVLTVLFVEASLFVKRVYVVAALALTMLVVAPLETRYAFQRLFAVNGTAGRPLTLDQGVVFDFVDRIVGPNAQVTMVPYPVRYADYWAGVGFWWDMEFWNKSVEKAAYLPGMFYWTPSTFPKLTLRFNLTTGAANVSPTPYVIEGIQETRFRIAGPTVSSHADTRDTLLIEAAMPWRAEWMTFGLTDDGWTKPGVTARIRIFAFKGQKGPVTRTLTLGIIAPSPIKARRFQIASGAVHASGVANGEDRVLQVVNACVPPDGFADISLSTSASSETWGDLRTAASASRPRQAGVFLSEIAVADEIGSACKA